MPFVSVLALLSVSCCLVRFRPFLGSCSGYVNGMIGSYSVYDKYIYILCGGSNLPVCINSRVTNMVTMQGRNALIITTVILLGCILMAGCTSTQTTESAGNSPDQTTGDTLFVYSGAGLKAPMQEISAQFGEQHHVTVDNTYAGSGALITQMELSEKGDIFIPGGTPDYAIAVGKGLVSDAPEYVAYHVPVIAVQKGNPLNITSVEDLTRPGVKIALGGINETAIGKAGDKLFVAHGIKDAVEENVVLRAPTINELVVAMNMGTADATLITIDKTNSDTMEAIQLPLEDNMALIIPIGMTTFTENPDLAEEYIDFVSSEEGKAIFAKHGFPTYPDEVYEG